MRVTMLYFGALKDVFGRTEEVREFPDGMMSEDVARELFRGREADFDRWRGKILIAVNCEHAENSVGLKDGDEVAVMPPMAGG